MANNNYYSNIQVPPTTTMSAHCAAINPHPQYLLLENLVSAVNSQISLENLNNVDVGSEGNLNGTILVNSNAVWSAVNPDSLFGNIAYATTETAGVVKLAVSADIANGVTTTVVTPDLLSTYVSKYDSSIDYILGKLNGIGVTGYATTINSGVVRLATMTDITNNNKSAVVTPEILNAVISTKQNKLSAGSFINATSLANNIIEVSGVQGKLRAGVGIDPTALESNIIRVTITGGAGGNEGAIVYNAGVGIDPVQIDNNTIEVNDIPQDRVLGLTSALNAKQNTLSVTGRFTEVVNGSTVDCTLTNGNYVNIAEEADENGKYPISVQEASIERKGVTQLVDEITEVNKGSIDTAVTPFALTELLKIAEHVITDKSETITGSAINEINNKLSSDTTGWIKFPTMTSVEFPGYCLAIAWGIDGPYLGKEGSLLLKLNKARYCKFRRIIYPMFHIVPVFVTKNVTAVYSFDNAATIANATVSNDNVADISVQFKNYIADPDENSEVNVISSILTYIQSMSDKNRAFNIKWFIIGYTDADIDNVWPPENQGSASLTISTSPKTLNTVTTEKSFESWFSNPLLSDSDYKASIGYGNKETSVYEATAGVSASWTINRVLGEAFDPSIGYYQISGQLKACVYGHIGNTHTKLWVDFSNAKINFATGTIDNVVVHRDDANTHEAVTSITFDPNKTTAQEVLFSDYSWIIWDDTHASYLKFKITVSPYDIKIYMYAGAYYQHGTAKAEIWHSPIDQASVEFIAN